MVNPSIQPVAGSESGFPDDACELFRAIADAGEEAIPKPAAVPVTRTGRALLIEANPFFRETIKEALVEHGYTVIAVSDCQEALRELMIGDFTLVLYDPTVPGMRGDMFYSAAERIDPEVCEHFVFMCGSRVDANTQEFIRSINGLMVRKPFEVDDLLAALVRIGPHDASQSARRTGRMNPALAGVFRPEEDQPVENLPAENAAGILVRPQADLSDDGFAASFEESDAAREIQPDLETAATLQRGRLLLLEAEPSQRENLAGCLVRNGYTVVAVRDAAEALRELLSGDFALVLYDPRMAGMSAAKFFHSLKRIEPDLCERFLFMIDEGLSRSTNHFIRKVDGFVLRKPFEPMDLLDALFSAETRGSFQDTIGRASADPILSQLSPHLEDFPEEENHAPQPSGVVEKEPANGQAVVAPLLFRRIEAQEESEAPAGAGGFMRALALAALILIVAMVTGLWTRHADARDRFEAASARRSALVTEWTAISRNLEEAISLRANLDLPEMLWKRISAFQTQERWTPVLSSLIPNDSMIEPLEIEARGETENSGAWEVRIHGLAGGPSPKETVDRFRMELEKALRRKANGRTVSTRFEQIGNKDAKPPAGERHRFTLIATLGLPESSVAAAKEER